tara:strand:+ start:541 stop:1143 length:603 start_codon:yes stop_codon:yes gene_type:complete
LNKILTILLFSIIIADVSNDSLAVLIKDNKTQILKEVKYIDPLENKKLGIEINPLWTMFYDDGPSISGSISLFNLDKKAEIAIPFTYTTQKKYNNLIPKDVSFILDIQYRYFLGKYRKGLYIMTGARVASFKEVDYENSNLWDRMSYNKQGISFGIGYRIFGQSGWYWGCSLYLGKYYFGSERNSDSFLRIELLKFGKTF